MLLRRALKTKNDLSVHTEMLTTGMMKLAKMGVIAGKEVYKQINKGKMVCSFCDGESQNYAGVYGLQSRLLLLWMVRGLASPYVIAK